MNCTNANCPAYAKCLAQHFGPLCKAIRATYGLSDTATITNADRIRSMSDEELAEFITDDMCRLICGDPLACEGQRKQKMLDWLRQEASEKESAGA